MSGSGTLQQANGDRYDGMWFRGLRSSSGVQTWARPPTAAGAATVRCSFALMLALVLAFARLSRARVQNACSRRLLQIRGAVGGGHDARRRHPVRARQTNSRGLGHFILFNLIRPIVFVQIICAKGPAATTRLTARVHR